MKLPTKKKTGHGGARKGAGAKLKFGEPTETRNVTLPQSTWAWLNAQADRGRTIYEAVELLRRKRERGNKNASD